jgi:hypothetical protein
MSFKSLTLAALAATALAMPAFAESMITVTDPYARVSTPMSKAGGAFMVITNTGDEDDRLIDVTSEISKRTELHTHKDDGNGNMQMLQVKEGFAVPAGGSHGLVRGGDHVMFMGLHKGLNHGDVVSATLVFKKAGEIVVEIPVDLERKVDHGKTKDHKMDHGEGHGHKDH